MIKFNVLVFVIAIESIICYQKKYCEICPNHTLCTYEIPGPSSSCVGYDKNALLTEENIKDIVHRINERRNFIALGHSSFLPGAANMKKITWCQELAKFAQRWVDQCDRALRPDQEDECRDLENVKVGQNIATIMGESSDYTIKSFIEIWFMQSLDYNGSVTYYNESRDYNSNYFSQLIWANTEKVGCGKAKFYVKTFKTTLVDRFICNFAPRGNLHGKPVYIIGFAATQCGDDMQPDEFYSGLCTKIQKRKMFEKILPSTTPLATSLLRIRNLYNDSLKQEIDPVYHDLNQMENESECSQSNKKTSHTLMPEAVKRSPVNNEKFWMNHRINNITRNSDDNFYESEKGHSRVYNIHNHRNEFDLIHPDRFIKDFEKYDHRISMFDSNKEPDNRKHNVNKECTRHIESKINDNEKTTRYAPCNENILKCTRGQKKNEITSRGCAANEFQTTTNTYFNERCACRKYQTPCPTANRCVENTNCNCVSICTIQRCPNMLRTLKTFHENVENPNDFHYYDIFSDVTSRKQSQKYPLIQEQQPFTPASIRISNLKNYNRRKLYRSDYSEIKRSVTEDDMNFKPFWQMDDYTNKKQPQLKSIRYTTLRNRKNKVTKKTKNTSKAELETEHITIKFDSDRKSNSKRITEKYLSFDELMHLRKYNTGNISGRRFKEDSKLNENADKQILRNSGKSETIESSTTEYTANTPFIRMKYCTRKLTCTWTAATMTDSAGSIIPGGAGGAAGHMGSRTPPGYVEGCTRTSTCTRDFMNRNKMVTVTLETTTPEFDTGDDDDYCERKSLNRRHSKINTSFALNEEKKSYFNKSYLYKSTFNEADDKFDCNYSNVRNKRNDMTNCKRKENLFNYRNIKRENNGYQNNDKNYVFSYRDLYYYVLKKIIGNFKNKKTTYSNSKCFCNSDDKIILNNLLLCFLMLFHLQ